MRTVFRISDEDMRELTEQLYTGTFTVIPYLHHLCNDCDVCVLPEEIYSKSIAHPGFPRNGAEVLLVPGKSIAYIGRGKWIVADSEYPEGVV